MFDRLRAVIDRRIPRADDIAGAVQTRAVVARLGSLLGPAFAICFITGLISHNAQSPDGVGLRPWPSWGYRVSQGIHVVTGIACLPLLLAKIFAAYPRILDRPQRKGADDRFWLVRFAAERGLTGILAVAGIVEVSTGLFNIFQWYAFRFAFVPVHYAVGWVAIGAIMIHVAVKWPAIRSAFRRTAPPPPRHRAPTPAPDDARTTRRGFLIGVFTAVGGLTLFTVGQTVGLFDRLAVLSPRRPRSAQLQGVPVNRTAHAAAVLDRIEDWRLTVVGPDRTITLDRSALAQLPTVTVTLPIACVEGWSVSAVWTGVRVSRLAALVGGTGQDVKVVSMERGSPYSISRLPHEFVDDQRTILATALNGEPLAPDHGYPARIIAPNRPGVLQTKWVERIEVL